MKIKDYKEDIKLLLDTKDNKTIANGLAKMIKYVEQSYNIPKDKKLDFLFGNSKKLDWDLYCKTDGGEFDYCDIAELYTSENAEQVAAFYLLYGVMLNEFHDAVERHLMSAPTDTETVAPTDTAPQQSFPPVFLTKGGRLTLAEMIKAGYVTFENLVLKWNGKKNELAYFAKQMGQRYNFENCWSVFEKGFSVRRLQAAYNSTKDPKNAFPDIEKIIRMYDSMT